MEARNSSDCIPIGVLMYMPYITSVGTPSNPRVTGTMVEVMDIIARYFKFCYRFILDDHGSGGSLLENGSWTGMMKFLVNREVEFTGLGLAAETSRVKHADFTEYLYMDEWAVSYRRPKFQSDVAGFIKPFTSQVWLFILVTMTIVIPVSFVVRVIHSKAVSERRISNNQETKQGQLILRDGEDYTSVTHNGAFLYESSAWTIGSIFAQAIPKTPHGESVRFLSGLWLLISLILATVYRSNLKAMLILPRIQLPFDNMEELIESGLPVWVPTDSIFHFTAENAPRNTSFGRIRKQFIGVDTPLNITEGILGMIQGEVTAGPFSALTQVLHGMFSKSGDCTNYIMSEKFIKTTALCIFLPRNSTWTAKLNPVIRQLRESGILNYAYQKGVRNATECLKPITSTDGQNKLRPMDLGDFYGVFLIYTGGILIVFVTFIVEIIVGGDGVGKSKKNPIISCFDKKKSIYS